MKLSIGTNWDKEIINTFKNTEVSCMYAKLNTDLIGGGRPSYLSPQITVEYAEEYIKEAQKNGIEFNYLLNAACLYNMEYNKEWHSKMLDHFEWVNSTGAKWVTVTIPYLIQLIRKRYPNLKISASTFARINSVQRAKYFEKLGVDEIPLDFMINRDFGLLKQIRKNVKCELILLVNNTCLYQCPFAFYHAELLAHGSQSDHPMHGYYKEYCLYNCTKIKYENPEELIKSRWIRPEDLERYEEIGINKFKLVDRLKPTDWIVNTVKAYLNRKYDGNLCDILNLPTGAIKSVNEEYSEVLQKEKEMKLGEFADSFPVIDNNKLDGFIKFFNKNNCNDKNCEECGYCGKYAKKAVSMPENMNETINNFTKALDELISSKSILEK